MGELKGLYINPELHKKIKILAAQRGETLKETVEHLLTQELKGKNEGKEDVDTDKR